MIKLSPQSKMIVLSAAIVGAFAGGIIVVIAARAIPKIMSGLMQNMMSQMKTAGCVPPDG
jgi:hypothetical protein